MKILLISFDFPYPPSGGSISRDYNLIKQLSRKNNIFWINRTLRGNIPEQFKDEMRKYCSDMRIIVWKYPHNISAFIKSIFKNKPYIIERFADNEMKDIVERTINEIEFDLILCDHIYLVQYLPRDIEERIPVIANNEDNGFTYYKRLSESKNFIRALYGKFEWKKMLKYEIGIYNRFKALITTSEKEKELIMPYLNDVQIGVIKNGVDIGYFKPALRKDFRPNIVYTSWLKYYPNQQAASNFALKVFPKIKKSISDANFFIVGKEPPENIVKLSKIDGITVTGEVDDVRQFIANADIAVVPLEVGGGTRLKILEAMAMGIPVVSTSLGAEGLDLTNGENIIISDNYSEMAEKIIYLLNNKKLCGEISKSALSFVKEKYDWDSIGEQLNDFVESVYKTNKTAELAQNIG